MDTPVSAARQSVRAGLLTAHLSRSGGGVYTSVRNFARLLESEPGLEIDVFGPARRGRNTADWDPIPLRTSPSIGPGFFLWAPGLAAKLAAAKLDLVHLHGLWMHTSMACHAFTRRTRKPHLISPHGMLDPWAVRHSGWKKRLAASAFENANIKSAACLHALNSAEVTAIRDYGFGGPVCVIPNGVDLPAADEPPPPVPWWAKGDPGKRTLLYLGRLHAKKGLPNLMEAWSRLDQETRKCWRLVIAGWDEHGHHLELRRLASLLRIESTVIFPGPLFGDEKRSAFHHCDGFILPSFSEGLPMAVLEAWACCKAVLMTPQCNLPEGFEAGAALRIDPEVESIATALAGFTAMDDAERLQIGANGRALAEKRYSWPLVSREMASVYRWMAGCGAQPDCVNAP